jgi:hypothetical protein
MNVEGDLNLELIFLFYVGNSWTDARRSMVQ